jgi:hypothetical protein
LLLLPELDYATIRKYKMKASGVWRFPFSFSLL